MNNNLSFEKVVRFGQFIGASQQIIQNIITSEKAKEINEQLNKTLSDEEFLKLAHQYFRN